MLCVSTLKQLQKKVLGKCSTLLCQLNKNYLADMGVYKNLRSSANIPYAASDSRSYSAKFEPGGIFLGTENGDIS